MSEQESGNGKAVVPAGDPTQLEMFVEMASIERERIASRNKMTEAMTSGFAHLNEMDKRQFEYRKKKLAADNDYRHRQLTEVVRFGWGVFSLAAVAVVGFGYMVLWGSPDQRQAALLGLALVGAFATGFLTRRPPKSVG